MGMKKKVTNTFALHVDVFVCVCLYVLS